MLYAPLACEFEDAAEPDVALDWAFGLELECCEIGEGVESARLSNVFVAVGVEMCDFAADEHFVALASLHKGFAAIGIQNEGAFGRQGTVRLA